MGINNDLGKLKAFERVFDLNRWGEGTPGKMKGYPDAEGGLNEKGRFSKTLKSEFLIENTRTFTTDDGALILSLRLKVAEPGHPALYDSCDLSFRPVASELEKPQGFRQENAKKQFGDLLSLFKMLGIFSNDKDWDTYGAAVTDIAENWDKLAGRIVRAGVTVSLYTKDGDLKGPYAEPKYWGKSDLDKKPETGDLPF